MSVKRRNQASISSHEVYPRGHDQHISRTYVIKPLRYVQIPHALAVTRAAMSKDSLRNYFWDADRPWLLRLRLLVQNVVNLWDSVYRSKLYAIDNGDAIIGFAIPGRKDAGPLLPWIKPLLAKFGTAEYWKRIGEFESAMKSIFDEAFGSQVDEMLEVQMLVTHPTKQGRGYGSALMQTVSDIADAQGRSTFVVTSDAYRFYEAVGYKLVGERWLGVDNPRWKGEPVPIRVLAREPHTAGAQTC